MRHPEICFFKELTYIKVKQTSNLDKNCHAHRQFVRRIPHFRKCFKYKPLRISK